MGKKSKKFPKPNNKIEVNVGDVVKAHFDLNGRTVIGEVKEKILRLESNSFHGDRINDLLVVKTDVVKRESFDRGFVTEVLKRKYPINPHYTNNMYSKDDVLHRKHVTKTGKDRYSSYDLVPLIWFFARKLYKQNPNLVPLTSVNMDKLIVCKNGEYKFKDIPGVVYTHGNSHCHTHFRVVTVRGKKFSKWVRCNIFKISYTHYETWLANTKTNESYSIDYWEDVRNELMDDLNDSTEV